MDTVLYWLGLIVFLAIVFVVARFVLRMTLGCASLLITPILIIGIIIILLWLT